MRDTDLPSPGILSNGFLLRREAAKAISAVQIALRNSGASASQSGKKLAAFFTGCATAMNSLVPADSTAPTVSTRVRTSATVATITLTENLQPSKASELLTRFVITNSGATVTRVISAVEVAPTGALTTIVITGVGLTVGDIVTYTNAVEGRNGSNSGWVRDVAGNAVATFTGALA